MYWVGKLGKESVAAVGLAANLMLMVLAATQSMGIGHNYSYLPCCR
jgi:Na+-driven multidrug efflux pump